MNRVVVRDANTREVLWSHEVTGAPFINYVPAQAFRDADAGLVTIETEEETTR